MRVGDERTEEVLVERDPAGDYVVLRIAERNGERRIRLTAVEARRLASLILFQAARLDRPRGWTGPALLPRRRSA